jgi:aminoglycoside phosphotransferase (APT) family kinase protein
MTRKKKVANIWDAQYTIDADTALKIIAAQFPELKATSIELFGSGWDNSAFIINKEYIFRFPRRTTSVQLIQHELAALPKIVPLVPLQIPNPTFTGKPTPDFPHPFLGYHLLQGNTACKINLSDEQRTQLAKPLAHFLKALHAVPTQEFEKILPSDVIKRFDIPFRTEQCNALLKELQELNLIENPETLHAIIASVQHIQPPTCRVIVHGDLYARHILLDENIQLTGIIDWGDIHLGNPAADLAVAHTFLPPSAHAIFKQSYGQIDQNTWLLARFRALNQCLHIIRYGHKSGDKEILEIGLQALKWMREN